MLRTHVNNDIYNIYCLIHNNLSLSKISLTKNYSTKCTERKKGEHIQIRTKRRRLVFYPTIKLVSVNLYTKYEASVLYSCGDIFENMERKKRAQIQG